MFFSPFSRERSTGFQVFSPEAPMDRRFDFHLSQQASERPHADALDDALTELGADIVIPAEI